MLLYLKILWTIVSNASAMATLVDAAVERLVDGVLAEVPAALRDACDRAGILQGLHSVGACDLATLGSMLAEDYGEVKAAVVGSSKPAFVAMLKATMNRSDGFFDAQSPTTATQSQYRPSSERCSHMRVTMDVPPPPHM